MHPCHVRERAKRPVQLPSIEHLKTPAAFLQLCVVLWTASVARHKRDHTTARPRDAANTPVPAATAKHRTIPRMAGVPSPYPA